jgi:threonine/homoserine/homoserine lactone efflux protein
MHDEVIPPDDRTTRRNLLLGVVVWFAHLNLVNALTSLTCQWGWFSFTIAGIPGLRFIQLTISLIAGLIFAYLIYQSWRVWRPARANGQQTLTQTEADRRSLMAFVTMLLNGLFFLFMLASLVLVLSINACA